MMSKRGDVPLPVVVTVRVDVERDSGALEPNTATVSAIEAAQRGDVVELGTPAEALCELNRDN